MIIRVKNIPPTEREYRFPIECDRFSIALAGRDDISCADSVRATVVIYRIETTIYLKGEVIMHVVAACSRCQADFTSQITGKLKLVLSSSRSRNGTEDEDIEFGTYSGEEIDLAEFCIEAFGLNLPQTLICNPECKGLCYICGADLNEKECNCQRS